MKPYNPPLVIGWKPAIEAIQSESNTPPKSSDNTEDASMKEGSGAYQDWE